MIDISVIIVSWNAKDFLIECLDSLLLELSGYSNEIIVVDNNSSDGSPETIESEYPDVTLIRNKGNLGFSKANNIGINKSRGRYLFFINSDVKILEGCVKGMVEFMDAELSAGMSGPRILNQDLSLQVSCRNFPFIWNNLCQVFWLSKLFSKSKFFSEPFMRYWQHDKVKKVDVLTGCFWVVRREALDEVGLLDEDFFFYGEDVDWCRRFNKCGWDVMFNSKAEAIHYGGASSSNSPVRFYIEMQRADLFYWNKHHGTLGLITYWAIVFLRQLVRIPFFVLTCVLKPKEKDASIFKLKRSFACIRFLFSINFKRHVES